MLLTTLLAQANFGGGIKPPGGDTSFVPKNLNSADDVLNTGQGLISFAITTLTIFAGILFLYQFIRGALGWITAGGDQKKISDARDQITQGVIGMVIIVAAYAIIGVISSVLGLDLLNPFQQIKNILPTTNTVSV